MSNVAIWFLKKASLRLVIAFGMTELNVCSRKPPLRLADYETMSFVSLPGSVYDEKKKKRDDFGLKWPERR